MPYVTYILQCVDGSFYVGCTNNLEKRIKQHNDSKRGAHYTKIRRPVILKYSEEFKTLRGARRREAEIKGWRREKKLTLIKEAESLLDTKCLTIKLGINRKIEFSSSLTIR